MMKPDILNIPVHKGTRFTWRENLATTFASDIRPKGMGLSFMGRIWSDACDEGFYVQSQRTGKNMLFLLTDIERDRDHDVVSWKFASTEDDRLVITVFND